MVSSHVRNKPGFVLLIAGNLAVFGLLLIVVEGVASYILFARFVMQTNIVAERRHTKYDADLGWVNVPNLDIPDMYGKGIYLRTNSQGFRNNHDISRTVPAGKVRIICSGDSFTLGYGVDNDHTWCRRLSVIDPTLETVNMGQGGYGIDQAYLWYKRDSVAIQHQVHLFTFITSDFRRMQSDSFLGYAKPVLDLINGRLVVKNTPVPRRDYYLPAITQYYYRESLSFLRTSDLLNRAIHKIGFSMANPGQKTQRDQNERDEHTRDILREIFEDLKKTNELRSSKLVLVYLPDLDTLGGEEPVKWAEFLQKESGSLGIPFINLVSEFRTLPYDKVIRFFISPGKVGGGHFSNAGNEFVARVIDDKLRNSTLIPVVSLTAPH